MGEGLFVHVCVHACVWGCVCVPLASSSTPSLARSSSVGKKVREKLNLVLLLETV